MVTAADNDDPELKLSNLESAMDENTFAAVQYKAIKLQTEPQSKPTMVM